MSADELCQSYSPNWTMAPQARAELERRGAVEPQMWSTINAGDVQRGMNKCEAEAAAAVSMPPEAANGLVGQWTGEPVKPTADSITSSPLGDIEVLLYPNGSFTLQNGRVTSVTKIN
jgi:hypothetical protein